MNEKEIVQGFSIKDKTACIIGCGGLGCNIAVHLAGAGIGKLILCDFDKISESNLNRQFLYTHKDIGKSKCKIAKKRLLLFSQDTEIECVNKKISCPDDMEFAKNCDIILSAVDNSDARKAIQAFAIQYEIPVVCGGIDGFYGMCYLFVPNKSLCPDCAGLNQSNNATYNISATAGIIGSAQASLAIQYLLSKYDALSGKIHIYDGDSFNTLQIKASECCPICKNITNKSLYEVI